MGCVIEQIYSEDECAQLFKYLDQLEVEYRKPYMRFGKMVEVPRGQASYTLSADIHYDYKVSGGSPPNLVMCDTLRGITSKASPPAGRRTRRPNPGSTGSGCRPPKNAPHGSPCTTNRSPGRLQAVLTTIS